jgi:phosphate transport system permease protein
VTRARFAPHGHRRRLDAGFRFACRLAAVISLAALGLLLVDVLREGASRLSLDFLTRYPSRLPERAGIRSPIMGSVWVVSLTALISFPIGVGAALYLQEYAGRHRLTRILQASLANLAGVPSVVYGILGLAIFVRALGLGRSVLAASLTLAILILPVVIATAQEAIRAVPASLREAAFGLGASRWQVIRWLVLPLALPGIVSGTILAVSRAAGEAAPVLVIGALTFVAFSPSGPLDPFTVLPIQIFNWTANPQADFHQLAAAAIVVLLAVLLALNSVAIFIRHRYERKPAE